VLKFGGVKALTKPLVDDSLKCHLDVNLDDAKISVVPQLVDNTLPLLAQGVHVPTAVAVSPKKVHAVKSKVTKTRTRLDKATSQLYDLESGCGPEKALDIDLGLYQMEEY
jgi:hypothetical protein